MNKYEARAQVRCLEAKREQLDRDLRQARRDLDDALIREEAAAVSMFPPRLVMVARGPRGEDVVAAGMLGIFIGSALQAAASLKDKKG